MRSARRNVSESALNGLLVGQEHLFVLGSAGRTLALSLLPGILATFDAPSLHAATSTTLPQGISPAAFPNPAVAPQSIRLFLQSSANCARRSFARFRIQNTTKAVTNMKEIAITRLSWLIMPVNRFLVLQLRLGFLVPFRRAALVRGFGLNADIPYLGIGYFSLRLTFGSRRRILRAGRATSIQEYWR
jgi:hypothetical protein